MKRYRSMKIKEIIQATNGKLIQGNGETEIKEFCKDTRIIKPGDAYIGIKGENFDGNTLWQKAFEAGADIVIVQGIDSVSYTHLTLPTTPYV